MHSYFVSCPKGIERILKKEALDGGLKDVLKLPGGISFRAHPFDTLVFLTKARTASRVYTFLFDFDLRSEEDIYGRASGFGWTSLFGVDQSFKVTTLFDGDAKRRMGNSLLCSRILKDAIVDNFRKVFGRRPDVETKSPPVSFLQRIEKGRRGLWKSLIYLDLCGTPLSHRGFNRKILQAPLREDLAAAIVMEMGVSRKLPFYDLMAGSGTVTIEALLKAYGISPSYYKLDELVCGRGSPFAFLEHLWYRRDANLRRRFWDFCLREVASGKEGKGKVRKGNFFANDASKEALSTFKANMRRARLPLGEITITGDDIGSYRPPVTGGVVFCHPPYGERLDDRKIEELYSGIDRLFRDRFKGSVLYVFTAQRLAGFIPLVPSAKSAFKNGPLDCFLLKFC